MNPLILALALDPFGNPAPPPPSKAQIQRLTSALIEAKNCILLSQPRSYWRDHNVERIHEAFRESNRLAGKPNPAPWR